MLRSMRLKLNINLSLEREVHIEDKEVEDVFLSSSITVKGLVESLMMSSEVYLEMRGFGCTTLGGALE